MTDLIWEPPILRPEGRLAVGDWLAGPVPGRVTQVYGDMSVTGILHTGIDIAPDYGVGTPIICPAVGIAYLRYERDGWGLGNWVLLDHQNGLYSAYGHMSAFMVRDGQAVRPGDILGGCGYTGTVVPKGPGGTHLHWGVSSDPNFGIDYTRLRDPMEFALTYTMAEKLEHLWQWAGNEAVPTWNAAGNISMIAAYSAHDSRIATLEQAQSNPVTTYGCQQAYALNDVMNMWRPVLQAGGHPVP